MAYRVEVTARAGRDLRRIYRDIHAVYSKEADDWFNGLESLVLSLDEFPGRGAVVPEDPNLRQVLYGNKQVVYRVLYSVDEPAQVVRIIHIRHGAREKSLSSGAQ